MEDEDGISMSSLPSTIATSLSQDVLAIVTRPVDEYKLRQIHAASVNGEKSLLQKLIAGNQLLIDAGDQFGRTALMFAVLVDRVDCAEWLLKNGSNIKTRDKAGRTALHWASYKGNYKCLKLLLNKRADWSDKDHEGQTALHLATRHKSPRCLALILKQLSAGEFDDQDNNKRTALHWSAAYGNLEHMRLLLRHDANIGIPDVEGKTPLHWAASYCEPNAVLCCKLLLAIAPTVINWQDYEGRTALHLGVADGNERVVAALTEVDKCNVGALDNMFRTPLHWAAVLGYANIVKMLLHSGADHASSDANGATPLHYAAQNNHAETVKVFLSKDNVTDIPDLEGRTALMWAAGKGANDVIRTMMQLNCDVYATDKNGGTVLHAAALSGHASSVRLLLEVGADVNAADNMKHTAIFRACEIGNTDVVKALIEGGARLDGSDQDGRSPLHWATLGGHAYICLTLAAYAVDPDLRDHSGRSPLQCAAYGGFVNCMSVLIENQADLDLQDNEGMTALHWACVSGHLDAVKLLLECGAFPNHVKFTEDRFSALDYALMGEHQEVAQYLIEQGGLSINAIQDIAVAKIQAVFRGYRVRKTFLKRKTLLMKHEKLRKDAAMKRAKEELQKKTQEQATGIFFDSLPTNETNKNQNNNNNEASAKIHRRLEGTDIALVVEGKSISRSESDETKTIEKSVGKSTKTPLKDAKHPALKQVEERTAAAGRDRDTQRRRRGRPDRRACSEPAHRGEREEREGKPRSHRATADAREEGGGGGGEGGGEGGATKIEKSGGGSEKRNAKQTQRGQVKDTPLPRGTAAKSKDRSKKNGSVMTECKQTNKATRSASLGALKNRNQPSGASEGKPCDDSSPLNHKKKLLG